MKQCILYDWCGHAGNYSPLFPYERFIAIQEKMAQQRLQESATNDLFIATTHPPTITLGARSLKEQLIAIKPLPQRMKESQDPDHLLMGKVTSYLQHSYGINFVKTNRGGSVWYHDHGVLQLYLIAEVKPFDTTSIIYLLEEILLRTLSHFGIAATRADEETRRRDKRFIGIWAHGKKIAALGIRIQGNGKRFVSMFGASINVKQCKANSMLIDPCGIPDCQMTSIAQELNDDYTISHSMLLPILCIHIQCVFDATLTKKYRT